MGEVETNPATAVPKKKITVVDSGWNELKDGYKLAESELDDTTDL